ncbi:sigma-70 family RNA polymerase sigma factor [Agrobacterium vitis]|uniref:Sigma-70 family RNA polymerase sigma factor n=2 Tax=Agrobacterium vitis TaxID=373 RepID=A0ABD6G9S6_AGRVI|nr:sigma-70 family RNA polymerase sigma factor [Agrobacterium vitis]MUO97896.1 sigma-70 family RNA polymerase sigma factor [Agrobacterium vitis]MUP03770.1 sigma-70 family RNA polymerase sigma factor [Agrobacterium vitis]MUZ83358.1 sigma-70 family RNA polymerase sigma factor [Agrobacterium vitis]MVA12989.1 sigma-70 family RNA polymerase sigma factor [Agrobacterium vitis]
MDCHERIFFQAVIQLSRQGVESAMTIIISQAALECHNRRVTAPRLFRRSRLGGRSVPSGANGMIMKAETEDMSSMLAAVARERDVEAFETLFRHYGPRVKAYMARQARDQQAAEELMQETMMVVWNKAALFDPDRGNVSAWIFTIARNLRVSAYRKQNRPEFDPNDPAFVPDEVMPADQDLENRQDAERLHKAMGQLPQEQLELLQRSFFHEIPHSALAKEFNLPLGTVKSRIRMAFAKLRAALEDRSEEDR